MKRLLLCTVLGLFVAGFHPAGALAGEPGSVTFTRLGGWTEGPCGGMVIDHQTVYLANGSWLEAVDVSDPALPRVRARVELSAGIVNVVRTDVRVCALTGDGVLHVVVDGGGRKLKVEGRLAFEPVQGLTPNKMAALGSTIYVNHYWSVHIVDVSRPRHPRLVRSLDSLFGEYPLQSVAVTGHTLFLGEQGRTHILDVSDPLQPVPVRDLGEVEGCDECRVGGEFLMINDGLLSTARAGCCSDLWELADPTHPTPPRDWSGPPEQPITAFAVHDTLLYVAQWELAVYTRAGRLLSPDIMPAADIADLDFQGDLLFARQDGLTILGLVDPFTPTVVGRRQTGLGINDVQFVGDRAYLLGSGQLTVMDCADPDRPVQLGAWGAFDQAMRPQESIVSVNGGRALVGSNWGATVLDVSEPTAMRPITPRGISIDIDWALPIANDWFVGDRSTQQRLSVATDGSAVLTPVDLPYRPCEVRPGVYVGNRRSGDWIPGIWLAEDGGDPVRVADLEAPPGGWIFAASGDIAYGLSIQGTFFDHQTVIAAFDLSTPRRPRSLRQSVVPMEDVFGNIFTGIRLTADGNLLYVWSPWSAEVVVLDVRDPGNIVRCGGLRAGKYIVDVAIAGDRLVVATAGGGFRTYKRPVLADVLVAAAPDPSGDIALRATPNPFNPTTRVTFTMPSAGPVEVSVFDLCGRRVRRLHAGILGAGAHAFDWRGTDEAGRAVAAGTYLVRASSDGSNRTVKVLLAK